MLLETNGKVIRMKKKYIYIYYGKKPEKGEDDQNEAQFRLRLKKKDDQILEKEESYIIK